MRILFVERDKFLRDFFGSKIREEFKGTIDQVASCKEAIKLLKTERPYDVIISELYTSRGTGLDLLRFKNNNQIEGKFILFSIDVAEFSYDMGMCLLVNKFDFKILCQKIRENQFL